MGGADHIRSSLWWSLRIPQPSAAQEWAQEDHRRIATPGCRVYAGLSAPAAGGVLVDDCFELRCAPPSPRLGNASTAKIGETAIAGAQL